MKIETNKKFDHFSILSNFQTLFLAFIPRPLLPAKDVLLKEHEKRYYWAANICHTPRWLYKG